MASLAGVGVGLGSAAQSDAASGAAPGAGAGAGVGAGAVASVLGALTPGMGVPALAPGAAAPGSVPATQHAAPPLPAPSKRRRRAWVEDSGAEGPVRGPWKLAPVPAPSSAVPAFHTACPVTSKAVCTCPHYAAIAGVNALARAAFERSASVAWQDQLRHRQLPSILAGIRRLDAPAVTNAAHVDFGPGDSALKPLSASEVAAYAELEAFRRQCFESRGEQFPGFCGPEPAEGRRWVPADMANFRAYAAKFNTTPSHLSEAARFFDECVRVDDDARKAYNEAKLRADKRYNKLRKWQLREVAMTPQARAAAAMAEDKAMRAAVKVKEARAEEQRLKRQEAEEEEESSEADDSESGSGSGSGDDDDSSDGSDDDDSDEGSGDDDTAGAGAGAGAAAGTSAGGGDVAS